MLGSCSIAPNHGNDWGHYPKGPSLVRPSLRGQPLTMVKMGGEMSLAVLAVLQVLVRIEMPLIIYVLETGANPINIFTPKDKFTSVS